MESKTNIRKLKDQLKQTLIDCQNIQMETLEIAYKLMHEKKAEEINKNLLHEIPLDSETLMKTISTYQEKREIITQNLYDIKQEYEEWVIERNSLEEIISYCLLEYFTVEDIRSSDFDFLK